MISTDKMLFNEKKEKIKANLSISTDIIMMSIEFDG